MSASVTQNVRNTVIDLSLGEISDVTGRLLYEKSVEEFYNIRTHNSLLRQSDKIVCLPLIT